MCCKIFCTGRSFREGNEIIGLMGTARQAGYANQQPYERG